MNRARAGRVHLLVRAANWLSIVLLASCGSDRSLLIAATMAGGAAATNVSWNGTTTCDGFVLDYPLGSALHGEGIEVYDLATSARVPLASTTSDVQDGDGYTFHETRYDLRALPLDAYLAVHRRSAGTGDPYTSDEEAAFTTFQGEPALVTTVHVLRWRAPPYFRRSTRGRGPSGVCAPGLCLAIS